MGDKESRPWIAFFSQSGKEIADISETLEKWPDLIITNKRPESLRQIDKRISNCMIFPNKPSIKDYEDTLGTFNNPLITLHGWLRIVPEEICTKYEMYNNHPGLIALYPELESKDPQVRAYLGNYPYIGCTLHEVSPEVDKGKIIYNTGIENENFDLDKIFLKLREISFDQWLRFLTKRFYEKNNCPSRLVQYWEEYSI